MSKIISKQSLFLSFLTGFICILLMTSAGFADEIVYSQGFESNNGGFTTDGTGEWEWGTPTNVGPPAANSGTKCWGTDLDDYLNESADGSMYSPAIPVRALVANEVARIRFYAYVNFTGEYSRGEFFVSNNGQSWTSLAQFFEDMSGGWRKYEFDVSDFAGNNIYLRFKVFENDGYTDHPGFYIDDIAITIYQNTGDVKKMTLEAWETAGEDASCPWVYPYDGANYVRDNDIYSVARNMDGEYRDYYLLQQPLSTVENEYKLEIRETEKEDSWTDMVGLIAVDHNSDAAVGVDDQGNIFAYQPEELISPTTAVSNSGENVSALIQTKDNAGFHAYSEDSIDLNFADMDVSLGARLVLRVKGFIWGKGESKPYIGPPAIIVQMHGSDGQWTEIGRLKPRFKYAEGVFDLSKYLPDKRNANVRVRLFSISHSVKYHEIDFAGLSVGPQPQMEIIQLKMASGSFLGNDVQATLAAADNSYVKMGTGQSFTVNFSDQAQRLAQRSFIFVSEGYYIPKSSTYFIYTKEGNAWVNRDGYSYPETDFTKVFNLSMFLPDTDGEFKVRIWQDYVYSSAGVDYINFQVNSTSGTLNSAIFLPDGDATDVKGLVNSSDDERVDLSMANATGERDRWIECKWSFAGPVNTPPSTNPVTVEGSLIKWTYNDEENDPQAQYLVEIWSGQNGTGSNVWNPALGTGNAQEIDFSGAAVINGQTYYARVKAFDGKDWGGWSETEFVSGITNFTVNFIAGKGGSILGDATQTVGSGGDCTPVKAKANTGFSFVNFTDSAGRVWTDNPLTVTNVNSSLNITANFRINQYQVNFTSTAGGAITGNKSQNVDYNSDCTSVTAVADPDYEFSGWTGGYVGSRNPLTLFNVTSNMTVQANFTKKAVVAHTVKFTAGNGGTLSGNATQVVPDGGNCTPVTAVAADGYQFAGWSGSFTGNVNPLTILNVTADMSVTANFQKKTYTVSAAAGQGGHVDGVPAGPVAYGSSVTLTAVPDDGYEFAGWTGCIPELKILCP